MQTSKSNPAEVLSRSSPKTPRTARQCKTSGSGSEEVLSSPNKDSTSKRERSPKVSERRTPQSPISEKKRETKASVLESQISQLQEDLKRTRDKMVSSELLKEQVELNAEDAKKQLSDMTTKLEETEKQLIEISGKDKSPLQELRKMSQDSDTILESELKAVAMVEKLEVALDECNKSKAEMLEELMNTHKLHSSMASELKESKTKVSELEILVGKLQSNLASCGDGAVGSHHCQENEKNEEMEQLKSQIMNLKNEDCKLRAALEAAELRYQEAKLQSTVDIRSAYEQAESTNSILRSKVGELRKASSDIAELQAKLADCETRSRINDEEKDQKSELEIRVAALQDTLSKKDMLLQEIEKENKSLKQQLTDVVKGSDSDNLIEARAAEQKAISKFKYLTEESDKNSKRTARVIEQLDAAQAANAELESELRKLKVQSDQWRKAAEAAASMLTSGNNGKYIDRTSSLDSGYNTLGGRISSPFSDDPNDEAVKKKNGNMLKKIGVLWKKGHNQK